MISYMMYWYRKYDIIYDVLIYMLWCHTTTTYDIIYYIIACYNEMKSYMMEILYIEYYIIGLYYKDSLRQATISRATVTKQLMPTRRGRRPPPTQGGGYNENSRCTIKIRDVDSLQWKFDENLRCWFIERFIQRSSLLRVIALAIAYKKYHRFLFYATRMREWVLDH